MRIPNPMGSQKASMSSVISSFVIIIIFLSQLKVTLSVEDVNISNVSALFVFGDSLADVGTNNYIHNTASRANFPPYGETFFHSPTGRFSDGRNLFDFIATYLGIPFPRPFLEFGANHSRGINFASGGSGLLDSTGKEINIIPFGHQVQQFIHFADRLAKSRGVAASRRFIGQAVFAASVGGNDISLSYLSNFTLQNSTSPQDFIRLLIETYKGYLFKLYHVGARKIVLLDVPPIGCTPIARLSGLPNSKGSCFEPANQMAVAFNAQMQESISRWTKILRGTTILHINSYDFVMNIIRNPKVYGFRESWSACCGGGTFNAAVGCGEAGKYKASVCERPGEYVFWDRAHPTERLHLIVGRQIWGGNSSVMFPFNLKTLLEKAHH